MASFDKTANRLRRQINKVEDLQRQLKSAGRAVLKQLGEVTAISRVADELALTPSYLSQVRCGRAIMTLDKLRSLIAVGERIMIDHNKPKRPRRRAA